jgi:hypothetical protein
LSARDTDDKIARSLLQTRLSTIEAIGSQAAGNPSMPDKVIRDGQIGAGPLARQTAPALGAPIERPGASDKAPGRPMASVSACLRELLARTDDDGRTAAERLAQGLLDKAIKGDPFALREVLDRTEGRPRQSVEVAERSIAP